MVNFFKNLFHFLHTLVIAGIIVALIFLAVHVYDLLNYKYISIEFKDLRPIREKIEIFYKGIKIGHVSEIKLCQDCKNTIAKCVLTYKGLLLPVNTTALMKKEKKKDKEYDFIELEYPKEPSKVMISNGTVLNGKTTVDVVHFMTNQNSDELESIKNNLAQSSEDLVIVLTSLSDMFSTMQDILKQNQKNIYQATYNFSQSTGNLKTFTQKVDTAVSQQELEKSLLDLSQSVNNLKSMTDSLNGTGNSLNETMVPQVQSTLYRTECLVANTNEIVCGVKETMKKRFGVFSFLFGTPITSKNVKNKKNNCANK